MKWNLGVFFGGASVEHEVSVISALQAMNNMKGEGYHIIPVYMAKNGGFYTGEGLRKIENFKDICACNVVEQKHWQQAFEAHVVGNFKKMFIP